MAQTLKFGKGTWATKTGSSMAYNDQNGNYKPLPFNVERDSIATRVNKQGLIEVVGKDKLRIDYKDSAKGVALLEPSRTNLLPYSNDFSQSIWTKTNLSILSNSIISPEGILSADKLIPDTTSGQHKIDITRTVTNGATVSLSAFVKKGEYNFCCLYEVTSSKGRFFDLSNGIQGGTFGGTPTTSNIENYNNDWYRISILTTVPSTSARYILYVCDTIFNTSFVGDGASGIYIWGAMLEQGSYATSYIPTSGSTVQRQADVANGSGNSEVFNDSEGVLFADISALADDGTSRRISLTDVSGSTFLNLVSIELDESSGILKAFVSDNIDIGILQGNIIQTQYNKIALKYNASSISLYVNGFELDSNNTPNLPSGLKILDFNNGQSNQTSELYGKTKEVGYYDAALTDSELEYLTSYRSLNELVTELNLNTL